MSTYNILPTPYLLPLPTRRSSDLRARMLQAKWANITPPKPSGPSGPVRGDAGQAQLGQVGPAVSTSVDRKSTRLNSSHLGISYAVFCLKKKKKSKLIINIDSETEE